MAVTEPIVHFVTDTFDGSIFSRLLPSEISFESAEFLFSLGISFTEEFSFSPVAVSFKVLDYRDDCRFSFAATLNLTERDRI